MLYPEKDPQRYDAPDPEALIPAQVHDVETLCQRANRLLSQRPIGSMQRVAYAEEAWEILDSLQDQAGRLVELLREVA